MSSEEAANGKKSHWAELEISGEKLRNDPQIRFQCVLRAACTVELERETREYETAVGKKF